MLLGTTPGCPPPSRCYECSGQPGARMALLIGLVPSFVLMNHEQVGTLGVPRVLIHGARRRGIYRGNHPLTSAWCSRSFLPFPALWRVYPRPRAQPTTHTSLPLPSKQIQATHQYIPRPTKRHKYEGEKGSRKNIPPAAMARPGFCHVLASVLLLAATVLFIVASVSAPVVNGLGVLVVRLPREVRGDTVTFGTFGHCVENGDE